MKGDLHSNFHQGAKGKFPTENTWNKEFTTNSRAEAPLLPTTQVKKRAINPTANYTCDWRAQKGFYTKRVIGDCQLPL
jgi:hypothetical protein